MTKKFVIAGIGELLWDLLTDGRQLGGAPANFIYHLCKAGDEGIVISSIGADDNGKAIISDLQAKKITTDYVQIDPHHPTGLVNVTVDSSGQPSYEIVEDTAWDNIALTPEIQALASRLDLLCFGSLGQRTPQSRTTIQTLVESLPSNTKKLFDINLRQHFFTPEIVEWSLKSANIVKLNDDELPAVYDLLNLNYADSLLVNSRRLASLFQLELLCITRGEYGSLLIASDEHHYHPGCQITVNDTVGAGDAFNAVMVHHYLRGASLVEINDNANNIASIVASQSGGMPEY